MKIAQMRVNWKAIRIPLGESRGEMIVDTVKIKHRDISK